MQKESAPTENPSRDRILASIRAGLSVCTAIAEPAALDRGRVIFDPVSDPVERFRRECVANLMECALTADSAASARQLAQVLQSLPAGEIFVQDDPSLRRLVGMTTMMAASAAVQERPIRWSSQGAPAEASPATITLAEALIAQTGSVLVTAACGGRGASVVAPCHIIYAHVAQLLPDLATALGRLSQQRTFDRNSFACVISGSSRTADIEKILVQGAHGPRRLAVILESGS